MEDSVSTENGCGHNELGWDYVGDVIEIVKGKAGKGQVSLSDLNCKSFKELELARRPHETPDRLASVQKNLEEMFATGNYPRMPTRKSLAKFIARIIQDGANQNNLLCHNIRHLEKEIDAAKCLNSKGHKQGYSDVHDILQCYDAFFLEIWSNSLDTKSRGEIFYFDTDRHI
jgi:hypothetical protein